MSETHIIHDDDTRFLLFKVAGELYGTPLLGIREVVEPQEPKPIPNTVSFFSGVINLRGQVVGVVDLRKRFGHEATRHQGMALMVFETESGPLAAVVDEIDCVAQLAPEHIDTNPIVRANVPTEFLLGIGKQDGRLISLIDLNKILGSEDLKLSTAPRV